MFGERARTAIAGLVGTALLLGCATPGQSPTQAQGSSSEAHDPCNAMTSAMAGAVVGAIAGAIVGGKDSAAKGAAIGAAGGALGCLAINVRSRQVKTAAQADQDFRNRNSGALPAEPAVREYSARLASPNARKGQPLIVHSVVELTNGAVEPVREVKEELVIFEPQGKPFKSGSKPFMATTAGRYENSFEVKMPAEAPQGVYALKTNVYVNGKLKATRDLSTQVVWSGEREGPVAAAALPSSPAPACCASAVHAARKVTARASASVQG